MNLTQTHTASACAAPRKPKYFFIPYLMVLQGVDDTNTEPNSTESWSTYWLNEGTELVFHSSSQLSIFNREWKVC